MRLVRIDRVAPDGATLELHPRLTVLAGVPPEMRRRLLQTVRALVSGDEPDCGGMIEVSGVRLALDRSTLDQLRLDARIDPILSFPSSAASPPASWPPAPPSPAPPSPAPPSPAPPHAGAEPSVRWVTSTVVADQRSELRQELRVVTTERTRLGEHMEATRQGLDSFSRASLDVCRGQIEALEARRSALRSGWEHEREDRARRHAELLAAIGDQRVSLRALGDVDDDAVRSARDRLVALVDVPEGPDPEAVALADRITAAATRVADEARRRSGESARAAEAAEALLSAREELTEAERAAQAPAFDSAVVRRLDEVRDEIFSTDDRVGLLAGGKGKRRIQELRAEEAVLLDRLGFDTYSAYVMGIPSVRADMERSARLDAARARVEECERILATTRADPTAVADDRAVQQLDAALADAAELIGAVQRPSTHPSPTPDDDPADLVGRAELVIATLRGRRLRAPGPEDPAVRAVMGDLASLLAPLAATGGLDGLEDDPSPRDLLDVADRWLAAGPQRAETAAALADRIADLQLELATLESRAEPAQDVASWARVESELDAALDRLAEAEERVRVHEEAMDRLAELRSEELALRERERELLAAISEAESADETQAGGAVVPDAVLQAPSAVTLPPPSGPATQLPPPYSAEARDEPWRLIARLAEQRAVSFAGSVPLVVDGLPAAREARDAVLERVSAMSDLVQIVVLSDDAEVLERVAALGADAVVVRV